MNFQHYLMWKIHLNFILAGEICLTKTVISTKLVYIYIMGKPFTFMTCLFSLFIFAVFIPSLSAMPTPLPALAKEQQEEVKQDDKKQDQKKTDNKQSDKKGKTQKADQDKPEIKEVPKSKKQSRPKVVSKPMVKVKPIKIIRPKIKKP
jgi:hypothetical protein